MEALREQHAGDKASRAPTVVAKVEPRATRDDARLVCARCAGFVAEARARIEVDGAFAHSFINPEGAIFRVGCFAEAPGVLPWGEASRHWTWFPGFAWQVATCRGCGTHLGWVYTAPESRFVGLILDRLVELPAPGPNNP